MQAQRASHPDPRLAPSLPSPSPADSSPDSPSLIHQTSRGHAKDAILCTNLWSRPCTRPSRPDDERSRASRGRVRCLVSPRRSTRLDHLELAPIGHCRRSQGLDSRGSGRDRWRSGVQLAPQGQGPRRGCPRRCRWGSRSRGRGPCRGASVDKHSHQARQALRLVQSLPRAELVRRQQRRRRRRRRRQQPAAPRQSRRRLSLARRAPVRPSPPARRPLRSLHPPLERAHLARARAPRRASHPRRQARPALARHARPDVQALVAPCARRTVPRPEGRHARAGARGAPHAARERDQQERQERHGQRRVDGKDEQSVDRCVSGTSLHCALFNRSLGECDADAASRACPHRLVPVSLDALAVRHHWLVSAPPHPHTVPTCRLVRVDQLALPVLRRRACRRHFRFGPSLLLKRGC